ncbi:MAG TPA: SDR family oxidoreductase [Pyrinomonadaceae bacterium]|nr:SDR family oxidoreductase [Pyrinomonadaceae bacterium]
MILITGATGTTGRDVVGELSRLGAAGVRVMVRDASKADFIREAGFELVEGDFERPETLDAALWSVERAFLLTPPSPQTTEQQGRFIGAARRAGVRHVVKFSAFGASVAAPGGFAKWHGDAEEELRSSGLAYTMLRPNFFMQNLLGQAQTIAAEGRIYQPVGEARASFVDTRDVAAVAARVLTEDGHEGRSYDITGPEALSYYDVAERLSAAAGREITYVPISPEEFRRGALAAGLPEWLVEALGLLNETFASGRASAVTDVVREITGTEPRTFEQFARDHASAFQSRE